MGYSLVHLLINGGHKIIIVMIVFYNLTFKLFLFFFFFLVTYNIPNQTRIDQ